MRPERMFRLYPGGWYLFADSRAWSVPGTVCPLGHRAGWSPSAPDVSLRGTPFDRKLSETFHIADWDEWCRLRDELEELFPDLQVVPGHDLGPVTSRLSGERLDACVLDGGEGVVFTPAAFEDLRARDLRLPSITGYSVPTTRRDVVDVVEPLLPYVGRFVPWSIETESYDPDADGVCPHCRRARVERRMKERFPSLHGPSLSGLACDLFHLEHAPSWTFCTERFKAVWEECGRTGIKFVEYAVEE